MKKIVRLLFGVIPLFVLGACKPAPPELPPDTYLTATFPPLPSPVSVGDSSGAQPTTTPGCDAALITDVTIPLDMELAPGQAFIKTWQVQNTSSCDWGPDIRLVYLGGAIMQAPSNLSVPDIPIGGSAKFSLEMIAPLEPGTYASLWQLQSRDGMMLGRQLWVRIIVPGAERPSNNANSGPATPVASDNCVLNAAYDADVTIPDDTSVAAEQGFVKTWRLRNTGTCPWESGFQFTFIMGDAMTDSRSVEVAPTAPGATVDVSVPMTAPATAGAYTGIWSMQSLDGTLFGARLFVKVVVPQPTPEPGSSTTTQPTPTKSPPSYSPPAAAVSGITNRARQIYLSGQQKGNKANVFAKVGDSITSSWPFLYQIGDSIEDLHDYSYLQDVINNFRVDTPDGGTSFSRSSLASQGGWTSNDLLDPAKADPICAGATPVECEYKRIKPSIAIIMIGTNDADENVTSGRYEENLRRVIDISIDMGVIPVLTTLPWNMYHDVPAYNEVIVRLARSYNIPLIDYWTLMEAAPDRGLSEDDVHPSVPPDNNAVNFSPGICNTATPSATW